MANNKTASHGRQFFTLISPVMIACDEGCVMYDFAKLCVALRHVG